MARPVGPDGPAAHVDIGRWLLTCALDIVTHGAPAVATGWRRRSGDDHRPFATRAVPGGGFDASALATTVTLADGERTTVLHAPGPADAPTVVLLHGLGATTALNFPGAFGVLSDRFPVLGLDHRGHGRGPRARRPFTIEQASDDVVDVADRIGADRLILAGYSMGGPVALHTARRHPDRVVGLVTCATAARFPIADPAACRAATLLRGLRSVPLRTRRRVVRAGLPYLAERTGVAVEHVDALRGHDPAALWEALQALARFDARSWAGALGVPAISIIPRYDRVVPFGSQFELAELLGAVRLTVDGDHRVAATHPEIFLPALTEGCRRLWDRAA